MILISLHNLPPVPSPRVKSPVNERRKSKISIEENGEFCFITSLDHEILDDTVEFAAFVSRRDEKTSEHPRFLTAANDQLTPRPRASRPVP